MLLSYQNVVGVGPGVCDGKEAVIVFVRKKVPKEDLPTSQILPDFLGPEGVEVDVIETHDIKAPRPLPPRKVPGQGISGQETTLQLSRTSKWRPAPAGVSLGHYQITAGTLGLWMNLGGHTVALSNNHVLANENESSIGDAILQPGSYDGGQLSFDKLGVLHDYEPIVFPGQESPCPWGGSLARGLTFLSRKVLGRTGRFVYQSQNNLIDAALMKPTSPLDADSKNVLDLFYPEKLNLDPQAGQRMVKSGRTTGITEGDIISPDATIQVGYSRGTALFEHQIVTGYMSDGGDSGSAGLGKDDRSLVGLLFAGSDTTTIFNRIEHILSKWPGLSLFP